MFWQISACANKIVFELDLSESRSFGLHIKLALVQIGTLENIMLFVLLQLIAASGHVNESLLL